MKDKTLPLLEQYLDGDYRIFPMAENKTTRQDIIDVEKSLNIRFPKEYVSHQLAEDCDILTDRGIYIEVKEDIWRRPKVMDVGLFWSFLYGIHTYTASKMSDDWMRLESVGLEFMQNTGLKAVPILKIIGDANVYCVDEYSNIVRFNHETNELEPTNKDFWQIFELELKEFSERKDRKKSELKKNGI